jgi:hypothetical protein
MKGNNVTKNVHICSMCIKINKVGKQEVGIWRVQKRFPQYGIPIWSLWPNIRFLSGKRFWTHQIPTACLRTLLIFIHIEHTFCICPFLVAFFSATIDDRILIEKCDEKCTYTTLWLVTAPTLLFNTTIWTCNHWWSEYHSTRESPKGDFSWS